MSLAAGKRASSAELLERGAQLDVLRDALADALDGRGRLLFVAGEAGVGKTALLRHFAESEADDLRVLWGACDALFTPRALGPLLDVASAVGGELAGTVLAGAKPYEVLRSLVTELERETPTLLVLEDVHWADEATLDVLRLLGRRLEGTGALVLASYRNDELDRAHPLQLVLGELAMVRAVGRISLEPLSPGAVAVLAEPHAADPDELFRRTSGNPFFVTEVLAAGGAGREIPESVRDAVLARVARLSTAAQERLEAVAIVPPRAELWLLEGLGEGGLAALDECLVSGMLTAHEGGISFRHELARLAVAEGILPGRSLEHHRRTLAVLRAHPAARDDLARLAHHAEAAQDAPAVLELAPAAAVHASARGAHREAAAQYARALRFGAALSPEERADLLVRRAWECYLTDEAGDGIEALEEAVSWYRTLGDTRREGDTLRALASMLWCPGYNERALSTALEAVTLLERLPPSRELAMAYGMVAELHSRSDAIEDAVEWGRRSLELATQLEDDEARGYPLNCIGRVELLRDGLGARESLEEALDIAERIGSPELASRALNNFVQGFLRYRAYDLAREYLESAFEVVRKHNVEIVDRYLLANAAVLGLETGRWDEALEVGLPLVLRERSRSVAPRTVGLVVLGLVRARRGDPDVWAPLDEALALAVPTKSPPRIRLVTAARAEAAWLEGRPDRVRDEVRTAIDLGVPARSMALAYWRWRAGADERAVTREMLPETFEMADDWKTAAALWTKLGCPYDA
ncbi:MAG TPA: AAA family ATPase, partial [Gaiellaceae bacterium]|nr:AAA family ATPase [Gaiellaceae bacterium]